MNISNPLRIKVTTTFKLALYYHNFLYFHINIGTCMHNCLKLETNLTFSHWSMPALIHASPYIETVLSMHHFKAAASC